MIGAPEDETGGADAGAAYVFDFDGASWSQTARVFPVDVEAGDFFGASVALEGDRALIGAPYEDDVHTDAGAVYVFELVGASWNETSRFAPADASAGALFGRSVGLDGDRAVLGAPGDATNGNLSGAAYVLFFDGAQWQTEQKLLPGDGSPGGFFGRAVSILGDRILVGARGIEFDSDNGTAYLFGSTDTTWRELQRIRPSDWQPRDWFGASVSLGGERMVVGALRDDDHGIDSGSAYIFIRDLVFGDGFEDDPGAD